MLHRMAPHLLRMMPPLLLVMWLHRMPSVAAHWVVLHLIHAGTAKLVGSLHSLGALGLLLLLHVARVGVRRLSLEIWKVSIIFPSISLYFAK